MTSDPNAPRVSISDDEALQTFSVSYNQLVDECRTRYPNFKQNQQFHQVMKAVNEDPNCTYERKLDPTLEKSTKKRFYNLQQTIANLDNEYINPY